MSMDAGSKGREVFETNLPGIQGLIRKVSRRHFFGREEREDFSSYALLRIMEGDFAVLQKFRGKSSLQTYLTVVVHRFSLDYRIRQWHKWRPAAQSRQLGPLGIKLDRLMNRDGHSAEEAIEILRAAGEIPPKEDPFRMASQIPRRPRPRFELLETMPPVVGDGGVERRVLDREKTPMRRKVRAALARALAQLPAQDRFVLKMRYQDGFTVRQIAETLHLAAPPLYRRLEGCLRCLASVLEREGVSRDDVMVLTGWEEDSRSLRIPGTKGKRCQPSFR